MATHRNNAKRHYQSFGITGDEGDAVTRGGGLHSAGP